MVKKLKKKKAGRKKPAPNRKSVISEKANDLKHKAQKKIKKAASRGSPKKIKPTAAKKAIKKPRLQKIRKAPFKMEESYSFEELITGVKKQELLKEKRKIEESKFDIGVPHNAQAVPSYDIPSEYNVNRAIVLTIDPYFVFTYWEVRPDSMHELVKKLGPHAKLTLRFYDISKTGDPFTSPFWDIEVFDRLGNWYLKLEYPEQKLCVDIGMKNELGDFKSITRSNIVKLPRKSLAAPGPLKWMIVSPDGEKIITEVEEYTDADLELLKKILGPYFFDLLTRGQLTSIAGSNMETIFQEISLLRMPIDISSSTSSWSRR